MATKKKIAPIGKNILSRFLNSIEEQGLEFMGKYYSVYRAIVHSTKDPELLDRIQVSIPAITGDIPCEDWFFPRGVYSGKNYGFHNLPKVGDLVLVSFELGSVDYPGFWEHGHWGKGEKPEGEELSEDAIWWVTPNGHKISLNDTKGSIYIKHSKGNGVVITEDYVEVLGKTFLYESNAKSPAVLGDKNADLLEDIISSIDDIYNAISQATVLTDQSGAGLKASIITLLTAAGFPKSSTLTSKVNKTKSQKVFLT